MDWLATDRYGKRWYPYIMTDIHGKHDILLHHELADTDMSDLFMAELASMLGPVTITPMKESNHG